jgi:hypothetical protein
MTTQKYFRFLRLALAVGFFSMLSGCATLMEEDKQEVNIRLFCADKQLLATCSLKNGRGRWLVSAPGKVTITNDNTPLEISCKGQYVPGFTVSALPMPSISMFGNVLFGGVLGTAVDVYNNTGMKYPESIDISNPNCQ